MRLTLSLFAFVAALIVVADAPAQFGGGKKGGGQPGGGAQGMFPGGGKGGQGAPQGGGRQPFGGGGMKGDAANIFEQVAKGRPYFLISETRTLRGPLTAFAKEQGITNDQITREQFNTFYAKMDQYMAAAGGGGRQPFGGGDGPMPPPGSPPIAPGQNPLDAIAQWAEGDFKRRDINADGVLVPEEMSDQLRNQIDRWDTNHDGLINLDEYKVYYSARLQMRDGGPDQQQPNPVTILIEEDYDRRPDVIRAGKLPKELPKWFGELDADRDGQVALHEWYKAGKEVDEFKEWDRNDDGLVTAEEVLFHMKSNGTYTASNGFGGRGGPGGGSMADRPFGRGQGEWNGAPSGGESSGENRFKGKKDGGGNMADFFKKKKGG